MIYLIAIIWVAGIVVGQILLSAATLQRTGSFLTPNHYEHNCGYKRLVIRPIYYQIL